MDPKVQGAMEKILTTIEEEFPDLAEVMRQAKAGEITESLAMEAMAEVLTMNPEAQEALNAIALEHTASLRIEGELLAPEDPEGPGYVFDSGVGLPRLNPLYEAALIERTQFDGDIPEARMGPLPSGAMPAVPVKTDARNPVALGHMLEAASEEVLGEVNEHRSALLEEVTEVAKRMEAQGTALIPVEDGGTDLALMAAGTAGTDPASYRRGQVPAPVETERITGAELAIAESDPDAGRWAWNFISTTQGRRSAERTIWEGVAARLAKAGIEVHVWAPKVEGETVVGVEWEVRLAGPKATQARYAPIDTAIGALASKLLREAKEFAGPHHLEVRALNTVDTGSVGWTARLVE